MKVNLIVNARFRSSNLEDGYLSKVEIDIIYLEDLKPDVFYKLTFEELKNIIKN